MSNIRIVRTDRVVCQLEVWFDGPIPFPKAKVKVLHRGADDYAAFLNVAIRNPASGHPDGMCGLGGTAEEAVEDLLRNFTTLVDQHSGGVELDHEDFEWSAHEDF